MTYLDRLEQELVRAGFREPRRVWPARAALTLAALGAATALVLALFGGPPPVERAAEPAAGEVKAALNGTMTTRDANGRVELRVGVQALEPVAVEVEASQDGEVLARGNKPFVVGDAYVDLALADTTRAPVDVHVTVEDTDGNVTSFRKRAALPAPPPVSDSFAVLRDHANIVPVPDVGFSESALGPDYVVHEVLGFRGGSAWVAVGDVACVAVRLPADGGGTACWPLNADLAAGRARPQFSGAPNTVVLALVPDGTTDVEGASQPVGNVIVDVDGAFPDHITWKAPDGSRQEFYVG